MKKRIYCLLITLCIFMTQGIAAYCNTGMEPKGYVTVSIEANTLGLGFVEAPRKVPFFEGENFAAVTKRFLDSVGKQFTNTGTVESAFYLARVADGRTKEQRDNEVNVPQYILDEMGKTNDEIKVVGSQNEQLGEFDYDQMSGWKYSIAQEKAFPSAGVSDRTPLDGDVIRWQFTIYGFGSDLGDAWGGGGITEFIDRDGLVAMVGAINCAANKGEILAKTGANDAYNKAIQMLTDIKNYTQSDIDGCLAELNGSSGVSCEYLMGPSKTVLPGLKAIPGQKVDFYPAPPVSPLPPVTPPPTTSTETSDGVLTKETITKQVEKEIEQINKTGQVIFDVKKSPKVSADIFKTVSQKVNKDVKIIIQGKDYSWTFNSKELNTEFKAEVFNTQINNIATNKTEIENIIKTDNNKDVSYVGFSYDGILPSEATIEVPVSENFKDQSLFVYTYDTNSKEIKYNQKGVKANGTKVSLRMSKTQDYILSNKPLVSVVNNGFNTTLNNKISYFVNGKAAKGVTSINDNTYVFSEACEMLYGFQKTKDGTYYLNDDGTAKKSTLKKIDDSKYYFDKSGKAVSSKIITYGKDKYYAGKDSKIVTSKIITSNKSKYYAAKDGKIATNKIISSGKSKYYAEKDGKIATSKIITSNKSKYFAGKDGKIVTNKLQTIGKSTYYFGKDSKALTNKFQTISKKTYYFSKDAKALTGLQKINKKQYHFSSKGVLTKSKTVTIGKKVYFAGASGILKVQKG